MKQAVIEELPHDFGSEFLVLYHAIHKNPASAKTLVLSLTPGAFYGHATKLAFTELENLVRKGNPITIESLLSDCLF